MDITSLIGEATSYDKKETLEERHPKSWLKSVSAFANGNGGMLVFGISDDDEIVGLDNVEHVAEVISERVKTLIDPIPDLNLEFKDIDGKKLVLLHVYSGQETPYYYIGDKQRIAFTRIGNESVTADRMKLKALVMKGSGLTYDTMPSRYKFENLAFTKLKAVYFQKLRTPFTDSDFISWGMIDDGGKVTNAAALIADDSPIRHSRIFCTRWNGLDMTNGLGEAYDDVELSGCVINMLQDAVAFVRNNSHKKWWKETDHREERPDYPERAVVESITNAIIHRDYMELGSEIHIDMYDDRMEIYSPGGMFDGKLIQNIDVLHVPSKRRNPLLADFFSRLDLMERRGSGMKKIISAYKQYEHMPTYRAPEFTSDATEFHVILWNLNYGNDAIKDDMDGTNKSEQCPKEFTNGFTKEFTKEYRNAQRQIYRLVSSNPKTTIKEMAEKMGVSERQIKKYIKRFTENGLLKREGGSKLGHWVITDENYERILEQ